MPSSGSRIKCSDNNISFSTLILLWSFFTNTSCVPIYTYPFAIKSANYYEQKHCEKTCTKPAKEFNGMCEVGTPAQALLF